MKKEFFTIEISDPLKDSVFVAVCDDGCEAAQYLIVTKDIAKEDEKVFTFETWHYILCDSKFVPCYEKWRVSYGTIFEDGTMSHHECF